MKIRLTFDMLANGRLADAQGALVCEMAQGKAECLLKYDFDPRPLRLCADAQPGDRIELRLMDHRIELAVNGEVQDEEWPCGTCLWQGGEIPGAKAEAYEEPCQTLPCVLGTFENAEGWRPEGSIFVGDCMPYVHDGRYHVLYLKDRRHHSSKWGRGAHQWEHLSTDDFVHWQIHPMAVPITDAAEGSICTGSWIEARGKQYLFYTVRTVDGSPASIRRSVSEDGYHFEKDEDFRVFLPEKYDQPSARDPKVICAPDGSWHMFLTTTLLSENRGCLAHLVSDDLDHWRDVGGPIWLSGDQSQPECPDYIVYNGKHYLISSLHWGARYLVSDQPFGPWKQLTDDPIPCSSVPKGAVWKDKIIFTGFKPLGPYGGVMTFVQATAEMDGRLVFEPLK